MSQMKTISHPKHNSKTRNLHNLPEDVAVSLVEVIRGWAETKGQSEQDEIERVKGIQLRDVALRSLLSSCRQAHDLYYEYHLQHITIHPSDFGDIHALLLSRPELALKIKSLRFMIPSHRFDKRLPKPFDHFQQSFKFREKYLPKTQRKSSTEYWASGALDSWFFSQLKNLETLQIFQIFTKVELVQKISGREVPLPLFTNLRKIQLGGMQSPHNLTSKQIIWVLLFAPQLESAVFGCTMSPGDFDYLSEYSKTYKGLSNVKKLAVLVAFISKDSSSKSRWDSPKDRAIAWLGGSKRSASIHHFLQVTKNLKSFELFLVDKGDTESLEPVFNNSLHGLEQSFETLQQFRLLNIEYKTQGTFDYSYFKNLKDISLLSSTLAPFTYWHNFNLPQSLVSLELPFYTWNDTNPTGKWTALEEDTIALILRIKPLPNLRRITVPSRPLNGEGLEPKSTTILNLWRERRATLRNVDQIKSGLVTLSVFDRKVHRE